MRRLAAVLFDLDGTLCDTLEDIATSVNAMLAARGLPPHPLASYRRFVGDGVEQLVERALSRATGAPAPVSTVAAGVSELRGEYARRLLERTRPYPGVPELLAALAARGIPRGVVSNKPHALTTRMVEALLPAAGFAAVLGARPEIPKKPDPAAALEAARALGVSAAEIVFLGDSDVDMRTALAAGMFPAGALWGFRDEGELRASGARALLARPEELLLLLEEGGTS
jgi:phosphoglycolate phosphatase